MLYKYGSQVTLNDRQKQVPQSFQRLFAVSKGQYMMNNNTNACTT